MYVQNTDVYKLEVSCDLHHLQHELHTGLGLSENVPFPGTDQRLHFLSSGFLVLQAQGQLKAAQSFTKIVTFMQYGHTDPQG